jgi:hypothetical protein
MLYDVVKNGFKKRFILFTTFSLMLMIGGLCIFEIIDKIKITTPEATMMELFKLTDVPLGPRTTFITYEYLDCFVASFKIYVTKHMHSIIKYPELYQLFCFCLYFYLSFVVGLVVIG